MSVLKCVRQDRHQYICLPYMPLYACLRCLCAAGPAPIYVPALYASMCLPYVSVCGRTGTGCAMAKHTAFPEEAGPGFTQ